jgi:Flp pilus assembly pilin Flp
MNKLSIQNTRKFLKLANDQKGATIVEYVMLLVVVLVVCVAAYKSIATKITASAATTVGSF